jgi:outer membrane protein assembly complex protein YaeT
MARAPVLTMGLAVLAVCGGGPAALAQPDKYEGKRIRTIQFSPVEQPIQGEEIFRLLPLRIGQALRLADVREAIYRLYATGQYTDIRVDARLLDADEVAITILTKQSWFIGRVSTDQTVREPPNRGQLTNVAGLRLGEAHRPEAVKTAVDSIQTLLEANGYFESRVEPRFEYEPRTQQIHIRFVINPGKRAYFSRPDLPAGASLTPERLARLTRWHTIFGWRPVTLSRTQRGLDRVRRDFRRNDQLMAQVLLDNLRYDPSSGRAVPELQLEAGPRVKVNVVGAKVSRSRLQALIPIYEEGTVDRDLLVEGARNLRDHFQSQGYFNAEVEFKQQRVRNDSAAVDYLVNLGRRNAVSTVDIEGNQYFDDETIRERMFVLPRSFQFRRGRYSETMLRRDEESVATLYRENGFRDVVVDSSVGEAPGPKGGLAVTLRVHEGPQWLIQSLELEGVETLDREDLLSRCTSLPGQPFSEFQVAADRDAILARYYAEGFSDASFEWSATPAAEPQRLQVRYQIKEGSRRFVRQVLVSGLQTTQPQLVNRRILLNPGDPLSQTRMAETQQLLYELGIFARVNVAIQNPEGELREKYVLYQVDEANRYSLTGGLGAEIARIGGNQASFENPAGAPGFSPRISLDFSRLNFRGIGHTVSFRSRFSNLQQRALVNYSAPRLRNVTGLDLSFTALADNAGDIRTFISRRREGAVQLSQRVSKADTFLYRFSYRRVGVDNLKIDPRLVPLLSQPVRIGILSGNLIRDKRDDPTDSTRGVFNTIDLGLASRAFGSQANFTRLLARNTTYHAYGRKKYVLARSLTFGWLQPFGEAFLRTELDSAADIPIAERFFSGGANSHRGFPENQAGPRDLETGFPLGGRAVLMHNLELRFPLLGENVGGVVFHDAGNTYSRLGDISFRVRQRDIRDFDYMVHALGFGVRYRTPIGPVRLDLAYGLNSPRFRGCSVTNSLTECGPLVDQRISRVQFHFSIGQSF